MELSSGECQRNSWWLVSIAPGNAMVLLSINSLWPRDAIWQQGTESTLAQVMAWCLTAPSHYLNQCWLIISKVLWHSLEGIIIEDLKIPISKTKLKIPFLESHPDLPGANELNKKPITWTNSDSSMSLYWRANANNSPNLLVRGRWYNKDFELEFEL